MTISNFLTLKPRPGMQPSSDVYLRGGQKIKPDENGCVTVVIGPDSAALISSRLGAGRAGRA